MFGRSSTASLEIRVVNAITGEAHTDAGESTCRRFLLLTQRVAGATLLSQARPAAGLLACP